MFQRCKPVYENLDPVPHEEYEVRDTRVSEYLRKYGTGKIDALPTDTRPEIHDPRDVDQMLDECDVTDSLGCDELDALTRLQDAADQFKNASEQIELTQKQREKFDKAVEVLQDSNASVEQKQDAYRILEELERQGKITRTRD